MKIEIIENQQQKKAIVRTILEALPDWFGVPESREQYIAASADEILETSHQMVEQANNITQSSQDVADNSHELANTSDTLTAYVQQFKI